jgi:hypothetical protein
VRFHVAPAAVALAIAASACAQTTTQTNPQTLADQTTRAVYNLDYDTTTAQFDDALKAQVTRASIGQLSDQMHALGTYQGLKPMSSDADKGRYDYEATFDKGTLLVQLRLDPNQKIGAYRISPESNAPTPAPTR